jgi:hypothetical protein
MTAATAVATVTSGFDEDSTATNLPIEISDDFIDIEDDDFLQELGFDPAQAAARSRPFRRTGTLAQALDGTGDRFVDIGDDLLEDGLLDLEDDHLDVEDDLPQELDFGTAQAATPDRLDVENDLQQELNLDTAQAAIPAARPVSHTGALPQADSGTTTTKRRGRPPGSRNKKTLQTEAAIAGAMQALQAGGTQGQRDEALQALQAALQGQDVQDNVGVTQGKKRGRPVGSKDNASRKKS